MRKIKKEAYDRALNHYTQQKEEFLTYLKLMMNQEKEIANKEFLESLTNPNAVVETAFNEIIKEVNYIIENSSEMTEVRKNVANLYQEKKAINREQANKLIQHSLSDFFTEEWIKKNIISKLSIFSGNNIQKFDDTALIGKIKMVLKMALRHQTLEASEFLKSQIQGLLYEHAMAHGFTNYFSKAENFENIVEVSQQGYQGGRTDVNIQLKPEKLNGKAKGEASINFGVQSKNIDLERTLASDDHNEKINVGGGSLIFKTELYSENKNPDVAYTAYFLSKGNNVVRAIGKDITIYGFADGQLKFTADLIKTLHYKKHYVLAMPGIQHSKPDLYIKWIKQKEI